MKARKYYMLKSRIAGEPDQRVYVTKLERWRNGTWAHIRFPGDRDSLLMAHIDDLYPYEC